MSPLKTGEKSSLAKKILAVMAAIGPLKKDKKNDFHNYQYASDELIVGALREQLIKNNLVIFPSQKSCFEIMTKTAKGVDQVMTKIEVEFELMDADSGESKVLNFFGYGSDTGDKGIYKASTGCEKYFLMKTFLIATPDDPEFEKTQRESRAAFSKQTPRPIAPSPAPALSVVSDFPPVNPKVERKIVTVFLKDVTMKTSSNGSKFYKLNGIEGENWTTFSKTVAESAKEFASKGTQIQIALDMNERGAVVVGIKPA